MSFADSSKCCSLHWIAVMGHLLKQVPTPAVLCKLPFCCEFGSDFISVTGCALVQEIISSVRLCLFPMPKQSHLELSKDLRFSSVLKRLRAYSLLLLRYLFTLCLLFFKEWESTKPNKCPIPNVTGVNPESWNSLRWYLWCSNNSKFHTSFVFAHWCNLLEGRGGFQMTGIMFDFQKASGGAVWVVYMEDPGHFSEAYGCIRQAVGHSTAQFIKEKR